jgi:ectoine hydroxylase-related dioxygenase (phytanoyl-CoA dioxygenase family)
MKTSKKHRVFAPIGSPALLGSVDELLGAGDWTTPAHWGQVMVTFPEPDADWILPSKLWHVDWHYTNAPFPLFGLKVFAFFGNVEPRGGGTLVVSGSHRVVERFVADTEPGERPDFRACRLRFMKHDPWFRALARTDDSDPDRTARFMESDHDADGIAVRVVELTGEPGDVVLAHPWMLHHAASNAASYPRMMRGKSFYRRGDLGAGSR